MILSRLLLGHTQMTVGRADIRYLMLICLIYYVYFCCHASQVKFNISWSLTRMYRTPLVQVNIQTCSVSNPTPYYRHTV